MRWEPLSQREPPAVIGWSLVILTAPVWGGLVAMLWLDEKKRAWLGPTKDWRPWFAWHPVHVWTEDSAVWLEWVERRRHWNMTDYRLPNGKL